MINNGSRSLRQHQLFGTLLLERGEISWCASPIEVKITVSGRIIRSRRTISPGQEIPASINANSSSPSIISSESATPNCEL